MRLVIGAAVVVSLAGCGGSSAAKARPFESVKGNFRAALPGTPELTRRTQETPAAGAVAVHTYAVDDRDGVSWSVTHSDFPAAYLRGKPARDVLDGAVGAMARQGMVKAQAPARLGDHPGRELVLEVPIAGAPEKVGGRGRIFLIGDRLYQVLVLGPASKATPEACKAFLDSFELVNEVADIARPDSSGVGLAPLPKPQPAPTIAAAGPPPPAPSPSPDPPPRAPAAAFPAPDDLPPASEAGVTVAALRWLDEDRDVVGGHGDASMPDGTRDQHLRLELGLPPGTIIDELTVLNGDFNRWVTKPVPGLWPVAVRHDGRPVTATHAERVGTFSGPTTLDLYLNTPGGLGPGAAFDLQGVVVVGGRKYALDGHARRP